MNLAREGMALVAGAASGVVQSQLATPVNLMGISVNPDALAEAALVLAGAALQQFSPNTVPNAVDGVVDGGLALLGKRAAYYAAQSLSGHPPTSFQRFVPNDYETIYRTRAAMYGDVHRPAALPRGQTTDLSDLSPLRRRVN